VSVGKLMGVNSTQKTKVNNVLLQRDLRIDISLILIESFVLTVLVAVRPAIASVWAEYEEESLKTKQKNYILVSDKDSLIFMVKNHVI